MKTINYCMICQVLLSPPKGQEFYPPFPISIQRFKHQIILLINFFLVQGNRGVPLTRTVLCAKHCRTEKRDAFLATKGWSLMANGQNNGTSNNVFNFRTYLRNITVDFYLFILHSYLLLYLLVIFINIK